MYRSLNDEKKTWQLIQSLYRDRMETEAKHQQESMLIDTIVSNSVTYVILKDTIGIQHS